MRLRSVPKGPSWCQPKQMVEGLCYINERSPRHWRYLSSWQFTSLLRTYQSFPIIFIELSCHLYCQKQSFFNILKARPTSMGGRLWHSKPSGEMGEGPSVATTLTQNHVWCTIQYFKMKASGIRRKKKMGLWLDFLLLISTRKYFYSLQKDISVTTLHTSVHLLCLHGCWIIHPVEGNPDCQVAGVNKQGSCSGGGINGHYSQKCKKSKQ